MIRRLLAPFVLVLVLVAGCGDDDGGDQPGTDSPPLTNELGVETFEPSDDPWYSPETAEPLGD